MLTGEEKFCHRGYLNFSLHAILNNQIMEEAISITLLSMATVLNPNRQLKHEREISQLKLQRHKREQNLFSA